MVKEFKVLSNERQPYLPPTCQPLLSQLKIQCRFVGRFQQSRHQGIIYLKNAAANAVGKFIFVHGRKIQHFSTENLSQILADPIRRYTLI